MLKWLHFSSGIGLSKKKKNYHSLFSITTIDLVVNILIQELYHWEYIYFRPFQFQGGIFVNNFKEMQSSWEQDATDVLRYDLVHCKASNMWPHT